MNISYDEYIRRFSAKTIICIGAGGTYRNFVACHMDKILLLNKIELILDNDKNLDGETYCVLKKKVTVRCLSDITENDLPDNSILFCLVSDSYVIEVLKQLDSMKIFDGMDCIYGAGTFQWGYSFFSAPKYRCKMPDFKSRKKYAIPPQIHYCWFGSEPMPKDDERCVESFRKHNPSYEIIRWSEENYDIAKAPLYVRQAYENKKYAFVSDYVRLDVIYRYGGIYLDTDVELFSSLDFVRGFRMMFAYMEYGELATGLGFASIPETKEVHDLMQMYEDIPFLNEDGTLNLTPCPRYTNEYFRRKGMILDNSLEIIDDVLFLPSDYLCPISPVKCDDGSYQLAQLCLSDYTVGIHWCNNTWKNSDEIGVFEKIKQEKNAVNMRLLRDWKSQKGLL
jgi:hypothetical protein